MSVEKLGSLKEVVEQEIEQILSYWLTHAIDEENGGFYGAVDLNNQPIQGAEKSLVLNARILWTFSKAAKQFNNPDYSRIARRAYQTLTQTFQDYQWGGYFSTLSAAGAPIDKNKMAYHQAFVLYALCQYQQFAPSAQVMAKIQNQFKQFEHKMKDPILPGYRESFSQNWKINHTNPIATHNEPKTMNTHLHIVEAFAALFTVWPAPVVRRRLGELLRLFISHMLRPSGHLGPFYNRAFQESKHSSAICSFGYDIEASWLLLEAAEILGDALLLEQVQAMSQKLLQAVSKTAVDSDGGLILESTHNGRRVDPIKHWWPQAEALIGFMNGCQMTGDERYLDLLQNCWQYIEQHFIDHEKGEWFARVDNNGRPLATQFPTDWKINPWKSPFHNGRACMQLIKRIDQLQLAQPLSPDFKDSAPNP